MEASPVNLRTLDLFCGLGGAGRGYQLAGYDVVGVDTVRQPDYPGTFIQADALLYLIEHGHKYDLIHASPPCPDHSALRTMGSFRTHGTGPLLYQTIDLLRAEFDGIPWVVENVEAAKMDTTIILCGSQFDLGAWCRDGQWRYLRRHRRFLSNVQLGDPGPHNHRGTSVGVYGHTGGATYVSAKGWKASAQEARDAMGMDWGTAKGVAQAIPPAYSRWIGNQVRILEAA